jgi:P-type Cu2+ transporter
MSDTVVLRPEIAALSMSGSSVIVAVNAVMLKRLHLPAIPLEPDGAPARPERDPARLG